MGMRSGLDPFGSEDVMIDQNIGNAYRNVRVVARYINLVVKLANSFEDGSLIPNIGEKGDKGDKGDKGETGQSIKGDKGDKGDKGAIGPTGVGERGPKGERGDQGDRGQRGSIGDDGASAYALWLGAGNTGSLSQFLQSLKGNPGTNGIDGTNGLKGDKGDKGDEGDVGGSGAQGTGILTMQIVDSHLIVTLSDGRTLDVGVIEGAQPADPSMDNTAMSSNMRAGDLPGFMDAVDGIDTRLLALES